MANLHLKIFPFLLCAAVARDCYDGVPFLEECIPASSCDQYDRDNYELGPVIIML